jgi:hypothetical protein
MHPLHFLPTVKPFFSFRTQKFPAIGICSRMKRRVFIVGNGVCCGDAVEVRCMGLLREIYREREKKVVRQRLKRRERLIFEDVVYVQAASPLACIGRIVSIRVAAFPGAALQSSFLRLFPGCPTNNFFGACTHLTPTSPPPPLPSIIGCTSTKKVRQ